VSNSEDEGYLPVADVLGAEFRLLPLPDAWTALDGVVLVKCLDDEGRSGWAFRTTEGTNDEEIIGALTIQLELWKAKAVEDYLPRDLD
jgi:hypothetical protein